MTKENLFPLIFRLVVSLPSRQEQLLILAEAWLLVAKEDLKEAWRNQEFKEAQTRQLKLLDKLRDFSSQEAEAHQLETEPAIEDAGWGELEKLEQKMKSRLAGA